jgi:hypothetical protein
MSSEEYHRGFSEFGHLGSTQIKIASESLKKFKHDVIDGKREKTSNRSLDIGSMWHIHHLERKTDLFIQGPDVSTKGAKDWKDFVSKNPGKFVLTPSEFDDLKMSGKSLVENPFILDILSKSEVERTFLATDQTGLNLKARTDLIYEDRGQLVVVDYKTTSKGIDKVSFSKTAVNYSFHLQESQYRAVVEASTGLRVRDYMFIIQSTVAPFEVGVYRLDVGFLREGEKQRRELLNRIAVALRDNEWPGVCSMEVETVSLPKWFHSSTESDEIDWGVA